MDFAVKNKKTTQGVNRLTGNVLKLNTKSGHVTFSEDLMRSLNWTQETSVNFGWDASKDARYPFFIFKDPNGYKLGAKYNVLARSAIKDQFVPKFPNMVDRNIICEVDVASPINHPSGTVLYGVSFGLVSVEEAKQQGNGTHSEPQRATSGSGISFE
jgi:hypothetical protein